VIGSSLRSRSYFDDVLTQTNADSKQLVNLLGSSLSSLKKGEFLDHHELFVPTAVKIAMGNNKIKLKIICLSTDNNTSNSNVAYNESQGQSLELIVHGTRRKS
jgi:hypothetical protein